MNKIWIYIKRTFLWIFVNRATIGKHMDYAEESHKNFQEDPLLKKEDTVEETMLSNEIPSEIKKKEDTISV